MITKLNENVLTAIIPVHNAEERFKYLSSWIEEIHDYPMQLIIVHDLAGTSTKYELKKIINQYNLSNLVFLEGHYGNPGFARNAGFEAATGDWIAFWDSDDKPILRTILNKINLATLKDDVLVGGFNTINAVNCNVQRFNANNASLKSVCMNPGIWRMVFRKKVIEDLKFSRLRMGEDQLFLSELNFVELNVNYVSEPFYQYTVEQKNQLTNNHYALADLSEASILILKHLKASKNRRVINFDAFLIIREQLTLIKKGDLFLRIKALKFIIIYFRSLNLAILISSLASLTEILINIRKHKLK
jgi:glycosyltransferase involved in cell wall biosynthesis